MLINLRNALMAGKRVPYLCELEYIESTGTQYINTGIVGKPPTVAEIYFRWVGTPSADAVILGCRNNSLSAPRFIMLMTNQTKIRQLGVGAAWATYGIFTMDTDYNAVSSFISGNTTLNLNGSTVITSTAALADTGKSLFLFANNSTSIGDFATARVYGCKIYQNDVLVSDLIPVLDWDGNAKMFDRVTGTYPEHYGTFVGGPEIWPVEYIQQTGTQWIDTLYPMADTRREVITVDWSGHSTTYREFMAGAASGSYLIEMSANGYYGTAPTNLSSIQVSQKDRIRWDYTVGSVPSLYINDVFAINDTLVRVPTGNVMTGGIGTSGVNYPKMKIYGLDIFTDADEQVRKMLPVRVGTDATSWEGAMIDTLTRRIYRNAGTGAFSYGNDLKYPIPAS